MELLEVKNKRTKFFTKNKELKKIQGNNPEGRFKKKIQRVRRKKERTETYLAIPGVSDQWCIQNERSTKQKGTQC